MVNRYDINNIVGNAVIGVLAILAVVLRVIARRKHNLPLQSDDYTIIAALVIAVGLFSEGVYTGATGLFSKQFTKDNIAELSTLRKIVFADILLAQILYGIVKISVLLLYTRIFSTKSFVLKANICMAVVSAWLISTIFVGLSATQTCQFWSTGVRHWSYNYTLWVFINCIMDIALDVLILCLPIHAISKLRMSRKRKIQVTAVFASGFFCIFATAMRAYYGWQLELLYSGKIPMSHITSITSWNDLWVHIECGSSIVAACSPTLAPFFNGGFSSSSVQAFRERLSSTSSSLYSILRPNRSRSEGKSQDSEKGYVQETARSVNSGGSSSDSISGRKEDIEAQKAEITVQTSFSVHREDRPKNTTYGI